MPMPPVPPSLSPLATSLASIEFFAIGLVGYGGETSHGEQLARDLAREPDAIATFEWLAVHPNRAARLYAYWALKTLAPDLAIHYGRTLHLDATEIGVQSGCVVRERPVREIAAFVDQRPDQGLSASVSGAGRSPRRPAPTRHPGPTPRR